MPKWLTPALKWGGIALSVVFAIAVIYVETTAPIPEDGETSAPVALYWVLLVVGVTAAIVGFVLDQQNRLDPDLDKLIRQALDDARVAGKGDLTQTEEAVRAVLKVRPDMTAPEALTAVEVVRRR